jgi:expansin (peptidoglycan-binding protein)
MKTRILLAGALMLGFAGTAMADEYYVVQGPEHHCTVTTTRPADREYVTQIGPLAFKSREEAQDRIKQTKVCSDSTTGSGTTVIKKEIDKD